MDLNRHVYIASHTLKCQIPRDRAIGAAIKRIMVMCAPPSRLSTTNTNHLIKTRFSNGFRLWSRSRISNEIVGWFLLHVEFCFAVEFKVFAIYLRSWIYIWVIGLIFATLEFYWKSWIPRLSWPVASAFFV